MTIGNAAVTVFALMGLVVIGVAIAAGRSNHADEEHSLEEWGLGGRRFGAFVSWCLIGGDFYTAYTIIAVPSLVFAAGADGFFALPYTILVYPLVFILMPRLWSVCKVHNLFTTADFARFRYGSPTLEVMVAVTGIIALLPYIALQLVGMEVAIGMIFPGGSNALFRLAPLVAAFLVLSVFTYTSGLRAPAMIAFVKDAMIYIVVFAVAVLVPWRLGGYRSIFLKAGVIFSGQSRGGSLVLPHGHFTSYATLALGSALAAFMYPHTVTSVLSANSRRSIQKNAVLLPAYTVLLGLLALTGLVALAAGIKVTDSKLAVPILLTRIFPPWMVGFTGAAIMVAALVPASIMAIAAANLFTRNIVPKLWRVSEKDAPRTQVARWSAVVVLSASFAFVLTIPVTYAIDLQLLGGIWILQTFPTIALGLWRTKLHPVALCSGWACGISVATWLSLRGGILHSTAQIVISRFSFDAYIGLLTLLLNLLLSIIGSFALHLVGSMSNADKISLTDYSV